MPSICDAHGHVWTTDDDYPWVTDVTPPGAERVVYSLDNYRTEMETLSVETAILVATPIHGPGSPYTVDCVKRHPDTFYGIVLVDHESEDIETHLRNVFSHENILGVRMTIDDVGASSPEFWSWMNDHEKQVHLLLGPTDLGNVIPHIDDNPDIDFVFDHLALFPDVANQIPRQSPYSLMKQIAARSNTYVKITHTPSQNRFPFTDIHDHIQFLLEEFGASRLVWGSDYIYHFNRVTPWQTLEFLDELPFLSDRDRTTLLQSTFQDLIR